MKRYRVSYNEEYILSGLEQYRRRLTSRYAAID